MKNIHVLPTDKPSRLWINNLRRRLELDKDVLIGSNTAKHIYITSSDEEIKEGDWVTQINYEKTNINLIKCITEAQTKIANDKNGSFIKNKIILTTDQDLIKDGVQAIDDEFLEWFVKNPNCEKVEVEEIEPVYGHQNNTGNVIYRLIIPKEEPKQETQKQHLIDMMKDDEELGLYDELKQETLEAAAENYLRKWRALNNIHLSNIIHAERCKNDFIAGAKWQQERMYSEEEVLDLLQKRDNYLMTPTTQSLLDFLMPEEWFEQFKKK